jgi:aryl-alcohol dehydrogenase-like predicted oxidoreductase
MLWRVIEEWVVPTSAELGVSQICWSPVAQGVLTGKYVPGQPAPKNSRATDEKGGATIIRRLMGEEVLVAVQGLRPIADELELTMAQLAVAWVLQNPNVACAIIGASKPRQITENVAASGVVLSPEVMSRIDDALGDVVVRNPMLTVENSPKERPC